MDRFTTLEGVAAPLKIINVDTDMIIPKQYLKTIKRNGLGERVRVVTLDVAAPLMKRPDVAEPIPAWK